MHPIFWRFAGLAAPVGPLVAIIKTCAMTTKNLLIRAGAAAWYQVTLCGTRYLVPGIWYQVSGTYLVPGTRYQVPGTWYQVPGTRYQVTGTRYQVPGTSYLVPGSRYLLQGTRYLLQKGCNKGCRPFRQAFTSY